MPDVLVDLIFVTVLLAGYYAAYSAGRNDACREARRQQHTRTDAPIPMDHTHGGDLNDP